MAFGPSTMGDGVLTITASGLVSGANGTGIVASNGNSYGSAGDLIRYGSDLKIAVAGVTGGSSGIQAHNSGTGALSITASGLVQGTNGIGIFARNGGGYAGDDTQFGTNLTIEVAGVTGADSGIRAFNYGTGTLSITARGAVTANGLYGYGADGIRARNSGTESHNQRGGCERRTFRHRRPQRGERRAVYNRQRPRRRCRC